MPNPVIGMIGASVGSAFVQSNAAKKAASQQSAAAQKGIDEQRRQFDAMQALLKPYVEAGTGALSNQLALAGVSGAEAQQKLGDKHRSILRLCARED